VLINRLLEKVK